jgi:hypothetical protein
MQFNKYFFINIFSVMKISSLRDKNLKQFIDLVAGAPACLQCCFYNLLLSLLHLFYALFHHICEPRQSDRMGNIYK